MANTHILEPNFKVLDSAFRHAGQQMPHAKQGLGPSFAERWAALVADSIFALLERCKLCHGPRILSAQCLGESSIQEGTRP